MALLSVVTIFMESFTIIDAWLVYPTETTEEDYRELVFNVTGRPIEEVGYIGGSFMVSELIRTCSRLMNNAIIF